MTMYRDEDIITDIQTVTQGRREMVISAVESSRGKSVRLETRVRDDYAGWRTAAKFYIRHTNLADVLSALGEAQAFFDEAQS